MENNANVHVSQQPNLTNNLCIIVQAIHCYIHVIMCKHPNCPQLADIFTHIAKCDQADECRFPKCIQTISHMKHYLNCVVTSCACFKFGPKSPANERFVRVKQLLLRNQFLIWQRKITPFRPHLLRKMYAFDYRCRRIIVLFRDFLSFQVRNSSPISPTNRPEKRYTEI